MVTGLRFGCIRLGKPQQSAYVERLNRTVRYECYRRIAGKASMRFGSSPHSGCTTTIITAHTWRWAILSQNSGWPWPLNSTSVASLKVALTISRTIARQPPFLYCLLDGEAHGSISTETTSSCSKALYKI